MLKTNIFTKAMLIFFTVSIITIYFCDFSLAADNKKDFYARFISVSGPVQLAEKDNGAFKTLPAEDALSTALKVGFVIATGETTCEIEFKNGARISVANNTRMQLSVNGVRIDNGGGWIKYNARKNEKGEYIFKVEMPTAFIGIRGTQFAVAYIQKISYIQVTEGIVDVTIKNTSKKYVLNPGEMLEYNDKTKECKPYKFEVGFDLIENLNKIEHKKINKDNNDKSQTIDNPWKLFKNKNNKNE